jgi:uncharacterized FAD-dependent dehydrogenase
MNIKIRGRKIAKLNETLSALEEKNKYNEFGMYWFNPAEVKRYAKLRAERDSLIEDTIAKLHAAGKCGPDGLTSNEADALDCECLYEFGDGSWC